MSKPLFWFKIRLIINKNCFDYSLYTRLRINACRGMFKFHFRYVKMTRIPGCDILVTIFPVDNFHIVSYSIIRTIISEISTTFLPLHSVFSFNEH